MTHIVTLTKEQQIGLMEECLRDAEGIAKGKDLTRGYHNGYVPVIAAAFFEYRTASMRGTPVVVAETKYSSLIGEMR